MAKGLDARYLRTELSLLALLVQKLQILTPEELRQSIRWMAKGLDERYFHTEPDNSTWVLSYASQVLLSLYQYTSTSTDT